MIDFPLPPIAARKNDGALWSPFWESVGVCLTDDGPCGIDVSKVSVTQDLMRHLEDEASSIADGALRSYASSMLPGDGSADGHLGPFVRIPPRCAYDEGHDVAPDGEDVMAECISSMSVVPLSDGVDGHVTVPPILALNKSGSTWSPFWLSLCHALDRQWRPTGAKYSVDKRHVGITEDVRASLVSSIESLPSNLKGKATELLPQGRVSWTDRGMASVAAGALRGPDGESIVDQPTAVPVGRLAL